VAGFLFLFFKTAAPPVVHAGIINKIWQIKELLDKREYYLRFYITKLSGK
jgi:hypothetical protein